MYISAAMRCSFHHNPAGNLLQDISDLSRSRNAFPLLTVYACPRTLRCTLYSIPPYSSHVPQMSTSMKTLCQHSLTQQPIRRSTRWRRFCAIVTTAEERISWSILSAGRTMTIVKIPGNQDKTQRMPRRLLMPIIKKIK